jgi:hypothetical protein
MIKITFFLFCWIRKNDTFIIPIEWKKSSAIEEKKGSRLVGLNAFDK